MATDVPDAQSLDSWQQAFQYPIPTVRRVEQELRRDIASSRERLRSLVGVRYRDLLDTAQTIVKMNEQIQQAEANLGDIGRRCSPRIIEKQSSVSKEPAAEKAVSGSRAFAAELTLLNNCTSAIAKILRTRGSSVLAAKLLVISRWLHKALTQRDSVPPFVDSLFNQLSRLRLRLLNRVDRQMARADSTTRDIVESLSAFCLASSASLEDAIRHFHEVRESAIKFRIKESSSVDKGVVGAMNMYIRTLQRTAELLSGQLSDALARLTAKPIMSDHTIQSMGELGIDVLQHWISADIRNFTPWIKHNKLSNPEAEKAAKEWSKKAFSQLCTQAANRLSGCDDFNELVSLRRQLMDTWLPMQQSTPSHSSLEVVQGIRDLINKQLVSILSAQSTGLAAIGAEVSSRITNWTKAEQGGPAPSLWSPDLAFLDFSDGAGAFKEEVANRLLGKDPTILRILELYGSWLSSAQERQSTIAGLRRNKWEDVVDDDGDEELETIGKMLKQDDPDLLQSEYQRSLVDGFAGLQASLQDAVANMGSDHRASKAAFLLRIIREIRRRIPAELSTVDNKAFAHGLVPKLHKALASEIVPQLRLSSLTRGLKARQSRCPGRTLWEGDPQLPIQPAPMVFKFLRTVTAAMEDQGQDLWHREAVAELKRQVAEQAFTSIRDVLESHRNGGVDAGDQDTKSNNHDESQEAATEHEAPTSKNDFLRDHQTQLLFDTFYLGDALAQRDRDRDASGDDAAKAVSQILEERLQFSEDAIKALRARAGGYWTRTRLLFGLLD